MSHDLRAIVGDGNKAKFSHCGDGSFFNVVNVQNQAYGFPIPIEDGKGTTLFAEFKAITLSAGFAKQSKTRRSNWRSKVASTAETGRVRTGPPFAVMPLIAR